MRNGAIDWSVTASIGSYMEGCISIDCIGTRQFILVASNCSLGIHIRLKSQRMAQRPPKKFFVQ